MPFDPAQPFEVVEEPSGFDPSQPFEVVPRRTPDQAAARAIKRAATDLVPAALDDLKRMARAGVEGVGDVIIAGGRLAGKSQEFLDTLAPGGPAMDEWRAAQALRRRQDTVQRLARGQAVKDLGKYYQPDPARDQRLDAQAAGIVGSIAPAIAASPAGVPIITAEIALQMGEAERAAAIARGVPVPEAEARGSVAASAGSVLGAMPGGARAGAGVVEKIATRAGIGGGVLAVQDAALQKALDGEVDWSRTLKAGAVGALLGGVLELPNSVAEVRARNDPFIKAAREFGFDGPRSELAGNGWLLTQARGAGFKGRSIADLVEWVGKHNDAVTARVRQLQGKEPPAAPEPAPVETPKALPEPPAAPGAEGEFQALTAPTAEIVPVNPAETLPPAVVAKPVLPAAPSSVLRPPPFDPTQPHEVIPASPIETPESKIENLPPLPPGEPAPAATATPPEGAAIDGGSMDAPVVAGAEQLGDAEPQVQTVYTLLGRTMELPADQPPPENMVNAEQWAELQAVQQRQGMQAFKEAFVATVKDNRRLAVMVQKNATSREATSAAKGRKLAFAPRADGAIDLIDAIQMSGGVPRPDPDARGGEFDGFEDAFGRGPPRLLVAKRRGGFDTFWQDLVADHPQFAGLNIDSAGKLGDHVQRALAARASLKRVTALEQQQGKFMEAALAGTGRGFAVKADPPRPVDELQEGDRFKVKREPFEVVAVSPDDGSVTVRDGPRFGTQILPAGAGLHTDKGSFQPAARAEPGAGEVFEAPGPYGVQLNEPAETYAELAGKLHALRTEAQSRPLTEQENAALDQLDRTLGQDFMAFYEGEKGKAGASLGDEAAMQKAFIQRRSEERLQGGSVESQVDMLGPTTDKEGQFSLFEHAAQDYLTHKGVTDPIRRAAVHGLLAAVWQARAERTLRHDLAEDASRADFTRAVQAGAVYETQTDLFPDATGRGPGVAEPGAGTAAGKRARPGKDLSAAGVLGRLDTAGGKQALAEVFREPGRVSSIIPQLVEGGLPFLPWQGLKIAAPEDFAVLAATLRNPYQERLGLALLDRHNVIIRAEVLTVGSTTQALANPDMVARVLDAAGPKARSFIVWHNHPSGHPEPSAADIMITQALRETKFPHGATLLDHLITNGGSFFSFKQEATLPMPRDRPMPRPGWEAARREDLKNVHRQEYLAEVVATVRTHGQTGALVVVVNRKNRIVGLDLLDPGITAPLKIFEQAYAAVGYHGGSAVLLHWPALTRESLGEIKRYFKPTFAELLDAGNNEVRSFRELGVLEPPAPYGAGGVREDAAPFETEAPLLITDDQGNVVGPQELGGLEHIKPVEMPELVKLARQMTGASVGLKNFPKARGMFYGAGAKGYIKLNRKIFRDPVFAQQVLAHEIGHATDFSPDAHLDRGNLAGRIMTMRGHLATTFALVPGQGSAVTAQERRTLQQQAAKGMGVRPAKATDEAGWKAWGEMRSKAYQELLEKRIQAGGLTRESVVRSELSDLDQWWTPWDVAGASESYRKYRESSVELYAQALSVMLNAPAELKERAPVFWQAWFNYLDRKPEAKQEFFDLWTFLHRGQLGVLAERDARLKAGFGRGEEIFLRKAAERDARQNTLRGIIDTAKQKHFDIFSPIITKARAVKASGRVLPWPEDPEYVFDAHPLADNDNYRLLDRVHKQIIQPLEASGFTTDDLGLYLFHNRVLHEAYLVDDTLTGRTVMANPQGITPLQARTALLNLRVTHGPERMTLLETTARKFQDEIFSIIERGGEAGIYSAANVARAKANRYNYATFAVLDFLEQSGHVPAAIRQQRGTLEDIANPFTASLLKALTALKLTEHNLTKRVAVNLLTEHFAAEITRAPETKLVLAGGRIIKKPAPAPSGQEDLVVLVDGKPQTWWVEPEIARMFERLTPASAHAVVKVLNWTFRNIIYSAFITYNPAFQLYLSPVRDLRRSYVNLPAGVKRRHFIGEQFRIWEAASARLLNSASPADMARRRQLRALEQRRPLGEGEARELHTLDNRALVIETLATRALGSPFDSFVRNPTREDYFGRMLQDYELLPPDKRGAFMESIFMQPVRAVGGWIERTGMTFEALPKMAAYRVLTRELGWPAHQAAEYVRNHIGVPNYLRRGQWATVDGTLLPFINVFMQGLASDVRQARGLALGPVEPGKQKFEWWRRMAENTLVPRFLQALAAAGLLGAALKEIFDGASEYDKANYTVLPLGQSNEPTASGKRKSVYLRIPEDETARLLGGTIHYLVQKAADDDPAAKASLTDLINFTGGQVPSVNPVLTLGAGWSLYAAGHNPIDQYRGEKVLSNVEFNAGGWEAAKGMLAWTWRETGGANFVRWDPRSNNVAELSVSAIPGLNRLLKVTDAGHRERQQNLETSYDKRNAQIRVAMPAVVNTLLGEYYGLSALSKDNRTPEQDFRLRTLSKWHSKVWAPNYEMMQASNDPAQWRATGQAIGDLSEAWKK